MHEAGDQSFRFRKDLGLPNQVCLFRHGLYSAVAIDLQRRRPTTAGKRLFAVERPQRRWFSRCLGTSRRRGRPRSASKAISSPSAMRRRRRAQRSTATGSVKGCIKSTTGQVRRDVEPEELLTADARLCMRAPGEKPDHAERIVAKRTWPGQALYRPNPAA